MQKAISDRPGISMHKGLVDFYGYPDTLQINGRV